MKAYLIDANNECTEVEYNIAEKMVRAAQEHFNINNDDKAKKMVKGFLERLHKPDDSDKVNRPCLFAWGHPWRIVFHCDADLAPILPTEHATRYFATTAAKDAERSRLEKMTIKVIRAKAKTLGMPHRTRSQYFHKGKGRYRHPDVPNKADIIDGLLRGPMTGSHHQTDAEDVPKVRPVSAGACAPDDIGVNSVTGEPEEMLYKE